MPFHPFDVTVSHITYTCLGGFVVLFGMFSLFIREKLYIGEAIWAFLFGVAIGPYGGKIFNPRGWANNHPDINDQITLEVTRVVLAIGVFAIGVELPKQYMKKHWKSLFFLLAPVMTWGWFVSAGLIFAFIPALSFLSSLVIAACLTPTDPILAAAVVGGKYADKHVPAHLRHLLAAESGCNDGAAFPFLFIAIYLTIDATDGHAIEDWFLITWLYEVVLGVSIGSVLGIGFRHLMKFCERNDLIDRQSYVAQYVSLALFTIGVTTMLGSDDLLAAFASGTAFAWDGHFNKETEQSNFSSVIDLLFNVAAFVYIGAWMPFNQFNSESLTLSTWRLVVIAVLVLLLRRLPAIIALYTWIPDIKTSREAVFSGHFGPMGVGAVFISTLAKTKLPPSQDPPQDQVELLASSIEPVVAFMVLCSIVTHGLSIPFFSLGRRVHSVSRTWSRHQSIDPLPEWATHTRHVTRPEDVVINRDIDIEKGTEERPFTAASDKDNVGYLHPQDEEIMNTRTLPTGTNTQLVTQRKDIEEGNATPWQEGHDLVMERKGTGDEVDVEVIHEAFPESGASIPEPQTAPLRHEGTTPQQMHQVTQKGEPPREDDDEWNDLDEGEGVKPIPSPAEPRPKSPPLNRTNKRRRNSFRRGLFSKASRSSRDIDRSPRPAAPRPLVSSPTPSQSRLDSLRNDPLPNRAASPVRSIRWDDLEERGHNNPHHRRTPSTPHSNSRTPAHSRPPSPVEGDSTSKVQFDLPLPPARSARNN